MPVLQQADARLYRRAERCCGKAQRRWRKMKKARLNRGQVWQRIFLPQTSGGYAGFYRVFTAKDIAEQLHCFDDDLPVQQALECMQSAGLAVAGVRRDDSVRGYVLSSEPGGNWGDCTRK